MTSEKYPITVARLPTFVFLGHSNAEGLASTSPMWNNDSHTGPPTASPFGNPEDEFYRNMYIYTPPIPWPRADSGGAAILTDIGDGEWLEMTTSNPQVFAESHPFPSPFRYPNNRGSARPNWLHDGSPVGGGTRCGLEIPFFWHWSHHFQSQTGMVKLAIAATKFMRNDRGGLSTPHAVGTWLDPFGYGQISPDQAGFLDTAVNPFRSDGYGWWRPYENFDFAPNSDRLYKLWYDAMVGAAAALPSVTNEDGESVRCKMDVRLVISWFGDNDSLGRKQTGLLESFEASAREFVRKVRHDIFRNDWTTLPEHEIVIVWPTVHAAYDNSLLEGNIGFINEILRRMAEDDEYLKIATNDWSSLLDEGLFADGAHVGPAGYVEAAREIYQLFEEAQVDPYDALAEETRVTVDGVMSRIRTYYTRARVSTDVDDDTLLVHINGALFHILNLVGDQAWFLRRRKELDLTAGPTTPTTLPRYVHRLLKIEDPGDPTRAVSFEQLGFVEGGKLQVLIKDRADGEFTCHFITQPKPMTVKTQLVPLPFQMIEWLVIEACRRLSLSSGNVALQQGLRDESRQMQQDCMRNMGAMQRSRNDRLQGQLRLPNPQRRRGRTWGRDW